MQSRRRKPPTSDSQRASREDAGRSRGDRSGDGDHSLLQRPRQYDEYGELDHKPLVDWCLEADQRVGRLLTPWERNYLVGVYGFDAFDRSGHQWQKLRQIADKVELGSRVLRNQRSRR
jgi:hypothetical protein